MQRRHSPPKHKHDGTSPLPLGMDWSPPPKLWAGKDTIWPHDHCTGWSYCVTIPSWVVLRKSNDSDPIVFYRVLIGIQSPEGVTTTRTILRRFNDFLKLLAGIKKAFPRKNIPSAPPKGLLRLKTRSLLEERRRALEDWIGRILSNIDVSRSVEVANFLELEASARTTFQDESTIKPGPLEYGSDTSEIGTSRDNQSENGTEDSLLNEDQIEKFMKYNISNIDEGLFMGEAILDQIEHYPKHSINGNVSSNEHHVRKLSIDSIESDFINRSDVEIVLPMDQRVKLNSIVSNMQRKLGIAKTDMEDLISRLYNEIAVKDYLTTKVKDLEVELETTKQKGKENLEQAILLERERINQMQWDMEELRRKSMEMELKLNNKKEQKAYTGPTEISHEKDEFEDLLKRYQELEIKSKTDIKVLVKEVKLLRNSQVKLKQELNISLQEKSEIQGFLEQEKLKNEKIRTCWRNWVKECKALLNEMQECKVNLVNEKGENIVMDISLLSNALDLLANSDNKLNILLHKAQLLWKDFDDSDDINEMDEESRKMVQEMIIVNGEVRKKVNLIICDAIKMNKLSENDESEVSLDSKI